MNGKYVDGKSTTKKKKWKKLHIVGMKTLKCADVIAIVGKISNEFIWNFGKFVPQKSKEKCI